MLSERSQIKKATYHLLSLYEMSRIDKSIETDVDQCLSGAEEWGENDNRYGISFGGDENVLELENGYTTL